MKSITRIGKGVIGAVVSFALFIGCLPITAIPVAAAATAAELDQSYVANQVTSKSGVFIRLVQPSAVLLRVTDMRELVCTARKTLTKLTG